MNQLFGDFYKRFNYNFRGDAGIIYIVLIMALLIALAGFMSGGIPKLKQIPSDAQQYEIPDEESVPKNNTSSMQLRAISSKKKKAQKVQNPKNNNNNDDEDTDTPPGQPQPTATPTPEPCSNIAVDFLVDESSSMLEAGKMTQVKRLLQQYVRDLPDNALVAIHSFSEPTDAAKQNLASAAKEEVAFARVGPVRDNIVTAIDNTLNPPSNPPWATYMREGFKLAQSRITSAKQANPDHDFYLVLISDGVPELHECVNETTKGGSCGLVGGDRNYDLSQDPVYTGFGQPNIPSQIKQTGVRIFSIGIFTENDVQVNNDLETLLRSIASSSGNYFEAENTGQLNNIFTTLSQNICN